MERTTKRTTTQQFQKLVAIMENNPDVARGMGSFGSTKKSRAELWEKFATELNAIGPPMRNGREWNKVRTELVCVAVVTYEYYLGLVGLQAEAKKKMRQTDEKLWPQEEDLIHNKA
ncbi:PREDICTED: uncharacterized protein LOC108367887 isoform X1 [Rhagoletis zephyria]|uniref:uncharacterized protein LOC108367887 isoform X1 n=1 Tax=Rhagoletis zephyria TaxID=28612 RepID=UPI0008115B5C|nr:PREDICTED: uncharacterized protein LOC108367887 isoform X1 [Rhagoletis zephyria]